MNEITMADIELMLETITATVLRNERYFSDLDAAAGDADFGVSLASGFRVLERDWEEIDRSSVGSLLLRTSMIMTSHVGGCSGPIWGTGFMRAGMLSKEHDKLSLEDLEKMLTASIEGIQQRGGAEPGDKTLLDALIPIRDVVSENCAKTDVSFSEVLQQATQVANDAIDGTKDWIARRGRQSFTGERSKGTLDPGIVAVATMMNDLCKAFGVDNTPNAAADN